LLWFAARIGYLAFELHPFIPPDETTHFGRVLAYAQVWGVPSNGPGNFELGLLDHRPWLYYWVLARSLALQLPGMQDLVFLRVLNGLLGLATAWVGILWVREWCTSPWARVGFAVMITNVLMFTGVSAAVSYDNAANLLAAAALLALTRFRMQRSLAWLLALAALVAAGCLAKRTFLPLALLFFVLLLLREWRLWQEWRQLPALFAQLRRRASEPALAVLLVTVLVLGGFVAGLYGGNLLRYGKLQPGFEQVVGERSAMSNRIFARTRILEKFRAGEITLEQARARAMRIPHEGDRNDTLFLLKRAQLPESSVKGRLAYAPAWAHGMLRTSVGYLGHRGASKTEGGVLAYAAVFAMAGLSMIYGWRRGAGGGTPADAAFLVVGYALVLMWFVNYPAYQSSRYIGLALQGRYLFPLLVPLLGLVAWSIGELAPARMRPWLVAVVGAGFLYGDLPWLLSRIGDRWAMPS
jgi:hypothetical protein